MKKQLGPNLEEARRALPKNLTYDAMELGATAFKWALQSSVGRKHRGVIMRTLIRRQCSMIHVKKIALAMVDDMEELSLALMEA